MNKLLISVESCASPLSTRRVSRGLRCMKKIKLSQGKYALVDDKDYEFLNQWKWSAKTNGREIFYAYRKENSRKTGKTIYMHRIIVNAPKGMDVDHINGDGLNNQRKNLRICTRSQNQRNRSMHRNGRLFGTIYYKHLVTKPWVAQIMLPKGRTQLGYYRTEESAHEAVLLALAINLL